MGLRELAPRPLALGLALLLIAGAVVAIEQPWRPGSRVPPAPAGLPAAELALPAAPDFAGATAWIDGGPVNLVALRGQAVLVDFWTYSCINCIHTFPHVQAWWTAYGDHGLTVVGVHTPEFRFEREEANVRAAVERYNLTYPVAMDSDYAVWNAYANHYWPAEYLIDEYGRVRHTHFGEGDYAETEQAIRAVLAGQGRTLPPPVEGGAENPGGRHSPELYASAVEGLDRVAIGNPEGYHPGQVITYARPTQLQLDKILLVGAWNDTDEYVEAAGPNASVIVAFRGTDGNLVAAGAVGRCAPVLLDGAPANATLAGRDVRLADGTACLPLDGARSYDFYHGPWGGHLVEIQAPAGFRLFTFDFSQLEATG